MQLKVKENITLWRNEGLIFMYHPRDSMYFLFMEVNALLAYTIFQQSIFFETLDELHVPHYVIFAAL